MIYNTVLALALAGAASASVFTQIPSFQKEMWESFKITHNKKYESMQEEMRRFEIFIENLKSADHRNARERKAGGSAVHGVTKFSDLSQAEFESTMLTADASLKSSNAPVDTTVRQVNSQSGLVDWTGIYTTPVKNQGYCGSCWAFSATEQIESDGMRTLGTSYVLGPEQMVQCITHVCQGCNGGWTEVAYSYAKDNAINTEANYPYTSYAGKTGTCKSPVPEGVVKVSGYTTIDGESNMAAYVQSTGPLSVCLDANNFNSYTGGIMSVCGNQVDHCVQAVGVDASTGGYWKVRNSWGADWGEDGYIRLAYGKNTCDITNDPTYTAVVKV